MYSMVRILGIKAGSDQLEVTSVWGFAPFRALEEHTTSRYQRHIVSISMTWLGMILKSALQAYRAMQQSDTRGTLCPLV